MTLGSKLAGLALATALATLLGCVHEEPAVVDGYAVYYPYEVPQDLESYPRVRFQGGWAYWVDERWYFSTPNGWVVFYDEPVDLARYRAHVRIRVLRPRHYVPAPRHFGPAPRPPVVHRAPPARVPARPRPK